MRRWLWFGSFAALLGCAPAHAAWRPQVVASGAHVSSGNGRVLRGTLGQAAIGLSAGANRQLRQGYWAVSVVLSVDVEPGPPSAQPQTASLSAPYPNPARESVRFALKLPVAAAIRLEVFDIAGRRLGAEHVEALGAGTHELRWVAPQGAAGVFFAKVRVGDDAVLERRFVTVR